MELEQKCVALFHKKNGLDVEMGGAEKTKWEPLQVESIIKAAQYLVGFAAGLEESGFPRGAADVRIHLIMEEFSEFLLANNEIEAFDGLIDLLYVILGTFDVYSWPAQEGFAEVHMSNMTKEGKDKARLRDKGEEYKPPNLRGVLDTYKQRLAAHGENHRDLSLKGRKARADLRRHLDANS